MPLLARKSVFMLARGLVPGFCKVLIAAPTAATVGDQDTLSRAREIGDGRAVIVEHQRADGNLQNHVRAGMARTFGVFAGAAVGGLEIAILGVANDRGVGPNGFQINDAAVTAERV